MTWGKILIVGSAAALSLALAGTAHAQSALISGLEDVNFGTIPTMAEQSNSQDVIVCSYRGWGRARDYSVIASGSGGGGAFELSSGAAILPYDVEWSALPGQTGGTMMQPGVPLSGLSNAADGFLCFFQNNASLTVKIRAADLATAQAGTYTGSLQITIVPE